MSRSAWIVSAMLLAVALAGCLSDSGGADAQSDEINTARGPGQAVPVDEREYLPFDTTGDLSAVLVPGPYEMLPVQGFNISVELPMAEGGAALMPEGGRVHIGLWMPDVPEGTKVPVILDAGPYYQGPRAALESYYFTQNLIDNIGPHGYAIAQASVMGTGWSNHCMDLMGTAEQLGIDAAVTWLGQQEWSNGNVGMAGKSYDGSTPFQAAMFGNEHLKTIIPSSGLIGMYDLMWRNGSSETRAPIMHNVVYGTYGVDNDAEDVQNVCPDYITGPGQGAGAYASGSEFAEFENSYWTERHFLERVVQNYEGSIYWVQGLQDWNVDPHMAFPAHRIFEEAGITVKGVYGQWAHSWPDQRTHHQNLGSGRGGEAFPNNMRYDFQQSLLEWVDYYLKGVGPMPDTRTEVQDNMGQWRLEETYPPRDAERLDVAMSAMDLVFGQDTVIQPAADVDSEDRREFYIPPLSETEDTRIVGNALLHVTATPAGPGGQLFAQLTDAETGLRFGHAVMDLRFHQGGKSPQEVDAGQPVLALMEFQAMDVVLPAGHAMILTLSATGEDYLPSAVSVPVTVHADESSVLKLFTVDRDESSYFNPPQWFDETAEGAA